MKRCENTKGERLSLCNMQYHGVAKYCWENDHEPSSDGYKRPDIFKLDFTSSHLHTLQNSSLCVVRRRCENTKNNQFIKSSKTSNPISCKTPKVLSLVDPDQFRQVAAHHIILPLYTFYSSTYTYVYTHYTRIDSIYNHIYT